MSSLLTPFVRSDTVGAILAETLGHPDRELSLAELGRRTGASGAVVHREVSRLVGGGVLLDRIEGRNRLVRANENHPLFRQMRELILATYGPVPVLRDAFDGIQGADKVLIHGSWAARRAGEEGAFPNDVDVLVIGDVPRRVLTGIATRVGSMLDMPVSIERVASADWESDDPSPFVRTIRSRPLIEVVSGDGRV